MKLKRQWVIAFTLIMCVLSLTACGGGEEVASTEEIISVEWPEAFSEIPAFTASPIENLLVVDDNQTSMEFKNVTGDQLEAYSQALLDAGFAHEPANGNVFTKIIGDVALAVGWNEIDATTIKLVLLTAAYEAPQDVVVQWPMELDGITPFQGYTPNQAFMTPDGLVTLDYSDVTEEGLEAYRAALLEDSFEPYDLGTGVESYIRVDAEGTTFLVLINPQDDMEGHVQISGIIEVAQ